MKKNRTKRFTIQFYNLNQKGQTLIETLAALSILSIIITAMATAVLSSLSTAEFNENETIATKYTDQGLEVVNQIRDQDYTGFKKYDGIYCLDQNQTSLGSVQTGCTSPNLGNFIRSVQIQQSPGCSANVASVTVTVSFTDGKCQPTVYCHTVTDNSCLSTVNPIQGP